MIPRTFTVLLYHGVYGDEVVLEGLNSSGKHLPASRFEKQMDYLSQRREALVSMPDIAAAYRGESELPDAAVAVTFDDGFENNFSCAWPILQKYKIPATIYLATGFIGSKRMIWTDRLEAGILGTEVSQLTLKTPDGANVWPLSDRPQRIKAFLEIKTLCKSMPGDAKDDLIADVADQCEVLPLELHPLASFMTWDQVRKMNESSCLTFGAHSVDHVSLAKVSVLEMRRQITQSVRTLEKELEGTVEYFSYPEGQTEDYNSLVIAHLRSLGIDHAPSAIDGVNDLEATGPFDIRRMMVGFEARPFPFADL